MRGTNGTRTYDIYTENLTRECVRVWCPVFSVYSGSSIDLKFIVYLGYPRIVMFAGVRVFKVSTRACAQ